MRISLVVARADNGVIGRDNKMPWYLPDDLKYFKRITMGKAILMGRRTFDSIGKPLPGRTNIVITRQKAWRVNGVHVAHSLSAGIELATSLSLIDGNEEVMVIGGAQIYREALPRAQRLYLTEVRGEFDGDTLFPPLRDKEWREVAREDHRAEPTNPFNHSFVVLDRVTSPSSSNNR